MYSSSSSSSSYYYYELIQFALFYVRIEEKQLQDIMELLAFSQAFVHVRRICPSSIFNKFLTIEQATHIKKLDKAGTFKKNCIYSMPSAFDQNCYLSNDISEKVSKRFYQKISFIAESI